MNHSIFKVLVITPLGEKGAGGIDRMMDAIRGEIGAHALPDIRVTFVVSRGERPFLAPLVFMSALAKVLFFCLTRRVDVIHINLSSHGSTWRKLMLARIAEWTRVPYVVHLHGSRFHTFWSGSKGLLRNAIDRLFARAASVIVLGKFWAEFVAAQVPTAAGRIVILPNATPAAQYERDNAKQPHRILFLGRLGSRKGVDVLVEALHGLASVPGWHATIAGDGAIDQTRDQVSRLGLASRIDIPGWVGPEQAKHLLSTSDILVLPSFDENLPMSIIEAFAFGLAVVATPVGSVTDIVIEEETGLLVPPGDALTLGEAIRRLLADPAMCRRLGANARRLHASELEIGQYVRRLVQIWHGAANRENVKPYSPVALDLLPKSERSSGGVS